MFKCGWLAASRCRLVPLALIRRGVPRPAPRSSGGPRPFLLVPAPGGRAARQRWRLRESGSRAMRALFCRLPPCGSWRVGRVYAPKSACYGAAGAVLRFVGCRALRFAHPQYSLRSCWGCAPLWLRRYPQAPFGRIGDSSCAARPTPSFSSPVCPCTCARVLRVRRCRSVRTRFPPQGSRMNCVFSLFLIFLEPFFSSATVFQKNK